jgi:hypothetical protein
MDQAAESWDDLQTVQVITGGREVSFLIHERSDGVIRLIGPCGLLGQEVRVLLSNAAPGDLMVRILWTFRVSEDLIENGGVIVDNADQSPSAAISRPHRRVERTSACAAGVSRTVKVPSGTIPLNSLMSVRRGPPASAQTSRFVATVRP